MKRTVQAIIFRPNVRCSAIFHPYRRIILSYPIALNLFSVKWGKLVGRTLVRDREVHESEHSTQALNVSGIDGDRDFARITLAFELGTAA